jgi:RecA-family ATPase
MLLLVTKLEQIAQKVGCIFMLTHHVGKAAILSGNGDSALAMKGSIALIDSCRMAIMISRPPKKIAEERRLGVSRRHRIVKTDKANHLADKGEVWFRVRDDGTLEYDELQNAWQPERIVNDVVAEIGGFAEDVIPPQGRMHAIIKADGGEGRFEAKPTSARAAFFRGRK